jgi:hypothetical protein
LVTPKGCESCLTGRRPRRRWTGAR